MIEAYLLTAEPQPETNLLLEVEDPGKDGNNNFSPVLYEKVRVKVETDIGGLALNGFMVPVIEKNRASLILEIDTNGRRPETRSVMPGFYNVVRGKEVVSQLIYPQEIDGELKLVVTDPPVSSEEEIAVNI
jgi:hypothetical protein